MKTEKDIQTLLFKTVAEHLAVPAEKLVLTAKLREDLAADSLDVVELTMALEDEFNLEFEEESLENLKTVQDLQDYLVKRILGVTGSVS